MKPPLRKLLLTAHIVFSVGWLGAVAAFLALAVAGLSSQNNNAARAAYIAMDLIGWFVIVPCGIITLLIGLVQSLGTKWGLFRHYWILIKFLLTVGATTLLLLHMNATSRVADAAAEMSSNLELLRPVRVQLVFDAAAALLVLLAATILSVYKPWGLTRYGRRKQQTQTGESPTDFQAIGTPWDLYILIGLGVLVLAFVVLHFAKGGMGQHGH